MINNEFEKLFPKRLLLSLNQTSQQIRGKPNLKSPAALLLGYFNSLLQVMKVQLDFLQVCALS